MRDRSQKLIFLPVGFLQLAGPPPQLVLQTALRGHVANRTGDQDPCFGRQGAERDVDWKLATVFAQSEQVEAAAH